MEFVYLLRASRPNFAGTMPEMEKEVLNSGQATPQAGARDGRVAISGACTDGALGFVVLKVAAEQEAKNFMNNDPAVRHGICSPEVHSFRISAQAASPLA